MKYNDSLLKLFNNKWILYAIFGFTLFNLYGYMMAGNINSVMFFILLCLIVSIFSKNMGIILIVSLVITNTTKGVIFVKEQFVNREDKKFFLRAHRNREEPEYDDYGLEGLENMEDSEPTTTTHSNSNIITNSSLSTTMHTPPAEPFEVGMKNKSQMGSRIDYSSTVEQAYDNLDKILGSDGIQRLTGDTHKLMEQQLKLAEAMKNMSPLLENANSMLKTLNVSGGGIQKFLQESGGLMKGIA